MEDSEEFKLEPESKPSETPILSPLMQALQAELPPKEARLQDSEDSSIVYFNELEGKRVDFSRSLSENTLLENCRSDTLRRAVLARSLSESLTAEIESASADSLSGEDEEYESLKSIVRKRHHTEGSCYNSTDSISSRISVSFGDVVVHEPPRYNIKKSKSRKISAPARLFGSKYPSISQISDDQILAHAMSPMSTPRRDRNNSPSSERKNSPRDLFKWLSKFGSRSKLYGSKDSIDDEDAEPPLEPIIRRGSENREGLIEMLEHARFTYRRDSLVDASQKESSKVTLTTDFGDFGQWDQSDTLPLPMYGRYTKDLGRYALEEAKKLKKEDKKVIDETGAGAGLRPYRGKIATKCMNVFGTIWKNTFARVGEDWVFLAMLGVFMAIVSFVMDYGISICNHARIWLYKDLASHTALQYLAWVSLPVFLILFSAGFVHILAPQAVGSGIPEMKTILRGVVLKEYLTFKTLIAKVIGLTATLGSGLPLGKEGPFVHIASIVATLLSKAVTSFKGIYENESRNSEMLAAACAVGVACSFAAPIGGVLFSIEVTSVYFAVRNYWRGFFAAVCGAMTFRLMAVWFNDEETLTALFKTGFKVESPFDPQELFVFATIGVLCGFLGSFFVWVHRQYVIFMRRNKKMKAFLQKSRLLYPLLVVTCYHSLSFPPGLGQFVMAELTNHDQVVELFSNITWTKENLTVHEFEIVENWRTPWTGIFINLIIYMIFTFCGAVVASTLPVPSGIFIPVFKIGAALGRLIGEGMATGFPNGLRYGGTKHMIIPGGYSIVGAAAMAGAVTHTISTSVIVFELTGQITHILPVMIAVLIANGIAQLLQPSVYDSIIQIKKLPYLPDILTATSGAYNIYVEDFMVRDVKYIWYGITYRELKNTLREHKKIRSLPLVDSPDSMILLGSIQRSELISMLEEHLGKDRRLKVINRWKFAASKALEAEQVQKEKDERDRDESRKSQLNQLQDDVHNKRRPPAVGLAALTSVGGGTSPIASTPANNSLANSDPRNTNTNSNVSATNTTPGSPPDFNKERRPSRFEVTKVDTPRVEHTTKKEETSANNDSSIALQIDPIEIPKSDTDLARPKRSSFPRKSILKKTNSFILPLPTGSPFVSPQHTPYATVHASDSRLRQAFEKVLKRTNLKKGDSANTIHSFSGSTKNIQTPMDRMVEMTLEEQRRWEEEELSKEVDFTKCHIDPAPFQLVERTSLLKVHSLFSMLGLNHAYVTAIGRIIGVVALKELRKAIEETNHGDFQTKAARRDSQDQKKSKD